MEGRVSVIIPTYNRPRWLPETIESVLCQTYPHIEIIVVDDGSSDDTAQVLEPYMGRMAYIYKENGGPGSAINAGIATATGEYIARIDDDDLFSPEKVGLQVEMFRQQPDLGLVAGDHHMMDAEGNIYETKVVPDFSKHGAFLMLLRHCVFSQPTVMVRKKCYDKVGLYKDVYAQDYDMWIRIARHYPVAVIHEPLAMVRRHDLNRTGRSASGKVKLDIQSFICEIMDTVPLEELVPAVRSVPHAHDVRGAIFLTHSLHRRAGREFYEAVKSDPQDMVHRFWSGILLRRMGCYADADECFSEIRPEHELYDASLNAKELTSVSATTEYVDEVAARRIRQKLSDEYNGLLDFTIALAKGRVQ